LGRSAQVERKLSHEQNRSMRTKVRPAPGKPTLTFDFFSEKEGLLFSPVDHPARPMGGGGSDQRELLASPCSPSPCASLATLLLPVDRAGEAQRQSRRNAGAAKPL